MSLKSGTLVSTHSSGVSSVAARIGNAAFFEPLIVTSPRSGTPPVIDNTGDEGEKSERSV
jgi:hypothetical protein